MLLAGDFGDRSPPHNHRRTLRDSARTRGLNPGPPACEQSGPLPAIVDYELKRELLRTKKTFGIGRLDAFIAVTPGRYLPLSDGALRLAADLWAKSRQEGKPTADASALDVDVIIAGQALSFGPAPADVTIATTNPKHISQFVTAKHWNEMVL